MTLKESIKELQRAQKELASQIQRNTGCTAKDAMKHASNATIVMPDRRSPHSVTSSHITAKSCTVCNSHGSSYYAIELFVASGEYDEY